MSVNSTQQTSMQGTAVQFPTQSPSDSIPSTNHSQELSTKSLNHKLEMQPRRQRSLSKTQLNYNPINSTSIELLNSPPPPHVTNQNTTGSIKRFPQDGTNFELNKASAKDSDAGGDKEMLSSMVSESPSHSEPLSSSISKDKQCKQVANLKTFVHVVKLASYEKPEEYLKILAVPESPDSLKIGRQNMPKATNKITDGFFDSRVLSRSHAELFVRDNKLYIRDLKSSNGTFINNKKLDPHKDYELKVGDKLDLGTTLESQVAHKKITCVISEFNYVTLLDYRDFVKRVLEKDDLASKRLQLFNSTVDALIFGELVDERQENDSLLALLGNSSKDDENDPESSRGGIIKCDSVNKKQVPIGTNVNENNPTFVSDLNIKPSSSMQDIIRKLAIAVNNEYIQQQRLKQMNSFMENYNFLCSQNLNRLPDKKCNTLKERNFGDTDMSELGKLRRQFKYLEEDSSWKDNIIRHYQKIEEKLRQQLKEKRENEGMMEEYREAERKYRNDISDLEKSLETQKEHTILLKQEKSTLKEENQHHLTQIVNLQAELETLHKKLNDQEEKAKLLAKKDANKVVDKITPKVQSSVGRIIFVLSLLVLIVGIVWAYYKPVFDLIHMKRADV